MGTIFIKNLNSIKRPMHKLMEVKLHLNTRLKVAEDDKVTDSNLIPTLAP